MRKNKFVKKNIIIVSMHLLGGGGGYLQINCLILYSWFHENDSFSVHYFNENYLPIHEYR